MTANLLTHCFVSLFYAMQSCDAVRLEPYNKIVRLRVKNSIKHGNDLTACSGFNMFTSDCVTLYMNCKKQSHGLHLQHRAVVMDHGLHLSI